MQLYNGKTRWNFYFLPLKSAKKEKLLYKHLGVKNITKGIKCNERALTGWEIRYEHLTSLNTISLVFCDIKCR